MSKLAGDPFIVEVLRQYNSQQATAGYLRVDGAIICYTLERPWRNNQENISSIPAGSYSAIVRYDHSDHWRIELTGVPHRTNVQIHVGNEPDETKGCILVGLTINASLDRLGQSREAYAALKELFYGTSDPASTPDRDITVSISDVG